MVFGRMSEGYNGGNGLIWAALKCISGHSVTQANGEEHVSIHQPISPQRSP